MVYHNRLEKPALCSFGVPTPCGPCKCGCCTENCDCSPSSPTPTEKALTKSNDGDVGHDMIEMFFRSKFAPLILSWKARVVVWVVILAWIIPAVLFVFKLEPTTQQEQFLSNDHPLQKAITVINTEFGTSSEDVAIDVYYVWGLQDLERKGANPLFNVSYLGKPRFEEAFALTNKCQDKILKICEDLRLYNNSDWYLDLIKRNDKVTCVYGV